MKIDESLTSTNTQTTESDDVPTTQINSQLIIRNSQLSGNCELRTANCELSYVPTTPEKVYEIGGGWNTSLSQTEQGIEGGFRGKKIEATDDELQGCLKQLQQVKTADDYWRIYERSSQLVEEAWKRLNSPEQLKIQQICDEGVDPLLKWKEGDRVMLWHPFAENKWGMATIKQVVRGACGFVYVLRDDGFGLHLGRDRLGLIAPI